MTKKKILIIVAAVFLVAFAVCLFLLQRMKGQILDRPGLENEQVDNLAAAIDVPPTDISEASAIQLPELMMPGPLNPIPWEEGGEYFVLVVANLGPFTSISQLHDSPFYPQLCSLYPELTDITEMIDTGDGDLWLLNPWTKNTSLALNEYNIDMFLGTQETGSGTVYYRSEDAKPMLLRMTTDDPGSVLVNAVDNEGHQLSWIPTHQPADNVMRDEIGVENITFNPVDNSAEFGTDYEAQVDGKTVPIRFYANRLVSFDYRPLMRYYATLTADNRVALLITDGDGQQSLAYIDGYAPDQGFTLTLQQGADFGLGLGRAMQFKP